MDEYPSGTFGPGDQVEVLRAAAAVLRGIVRDLPRGPWRWGDPDLGDEPGVGVLPRPEPWPSGLPSGWTGPLDEPALLGRRDPFAPHPDDGPPLHPRVTPRPPAVLEPGVAEALAALLDVLAERSGRDEHAAASEAFQAGVTVARSVLRACSTPVARGSGESELR